VDRSNTRIMDSSPSRDIDVYMYAVVQCLHCTLSVEAMRWMDCRTIQRVLPTVFIVREFASDTELGEIEQCVKNGGEYFIVLL
jgi:hypothetical protein